MDLSTILSRVQFAFTVGYHYIFPQITMGLAFLIVLLKTLYLIKKDERYNISARFWAKIFATSFVLGVVTGIPMEFQFGTNWARFSAYAGDIIAQTLAMEGAFAFFLESAFLGVFLFGEKVFGQRVHWLAAVMVWLGTWASGAFIVASNAWMQHPVGYTIAGNRLHISNYWEVLLNPWIFPQYLHTMSGAVITGAFIMAGLGAYYLLARSHVDYGRIFVTLGVIVGLIASVIQLYPSGDLEGQQVAKYQPAKLAAFEGLFHTEQGAGIVILGQPNTATGQLDNPLIVPKVLSFLTYRRWEAVVKGLDAFPPNQRPDSIELLYYSYHIMVGLGTFFIPIMGVACLLWLWKRRLFTTRWMLWILMLATPFPIIANTAGWFTTELGRQPWIIYGLLPTAQGSSANLSAGNVLFTLLGFAGMYLLLGLLYVVLSVTEALKGPESGEGEEAEVVEEGGLPGLATGTVAEG
ncbi:cytochrome ubiquinol oxidase subunit I [Thermogemmatispora tikiterensis]|uniref:Cytochrome BD ubiquinol oxidase subunit I n=1 Tax=Thermogemmatispora tikiterensis TaxID=1825093 RepID=A0A328VK06_9CHLR|nr:cytochrome ubiquinol oxidase subunit I [Thermogemmatispora tikiterensis]RAQ97241.1 cytochrome BD ubiquinol oxidase subunit I [Thermogemmatispora tikiterensis]